MQIHDLITAASESTRRVKERACREGHCDINPMIEVWRGADPVAIVSLSDHDRDEILSTAAVCASGFDADAIAIAFEGYAGVGTAFRSPNINPMTGKRWRDQEMQEVVQKHNGIAMKWVTETVVVTVVNRAGDLATTCQPYVYSPQQGVTWGKAKDMSTMNPNWTARGLVPEVMVEMMLAPSGGSMVPYSDVPMERAVRDAQTAQWISSERCAVALYTDVQDTDRINVISKIGTILY